MLFSCYLLQARFKGATTLAPTALPLCWLIHARPPCRGNHPAPRIARETGRLGFRVKRWSRSQNANADPGVRFRAYVRYRRALRDYRRMHACGGQRTNDFIMGINRAIATRYDKLPTER